MFKDPPNEHEQANSDQGRSADLAVQAALACTFGRC
jgi:hypothetical protein